MRRIAAFAVVTGLLVVAACSDRSEPPTAPDESAATAGTALDPAAGPQAPGAFATGRVLARFEPGAPAAEIAADQGATLEREIALGIRVLSVPEGRELAVARALERNPSVRYAEPDFIRTYGDPTVVPVSDPFFGYKWDLDNDGSIYSSTGDVLTSTGAADADTDWLEAFEQLGAHGGTARLGIMDTGIRADHEDLAGRVAVQYDFHDGDADAADDDGHGTHVAGIATAHGDNGVGVAGVAYGDGVDLAVAKVCGPIHPPRFGQAYGCYTSSIVDGITWAVDNGSNVLNLSLGGGSASSAEQEALAYARTNDVLPVCAAGNDGGAVSYPGAFPECLAVSATDWSDGLASYSNYGPEVELAAPGGDNENADGYSYILSSYNGGPDSYAFIAGTSMASPQVAGLATLLHALGMADDGDKAARMKSSADDLGASGTDDLFGAGRINVYNAVNGLDGGGGTTNAAPTASFTYSCTDLSCDFDGTGSIDSDGAITAYDWTFGDGAPPASGATVSHTYESGGTYTVTLTVTDDGGATGSESQDVSVSESTGGGIGLTATGYKVRGLQKADLEWSGATSGDVDVYRNESLVATTANDGAYTDAIDQRGSASYTYLLCEAGTATCSNEVTVTF